MAQASSEEPGLKIKNGFYVRKSVAIILGVFFVCAVVGTGLMVHYISPETPIPVDDVANDLNSMQGLDADIDPSSLRLPTSLIPVHQLVRLQPFISATELYRTSGFTEITFNCVEATNTIIIHSLDLEIMFETVKIVKADDPSGPSFAINTMASNIPKQFFIINLSGTLQAGTSYILSMRFSGYLNDNMIGFYKSVYQDQNDTDVYLATTQFEATDARRAFPCFDEPALKATFDIQILRQGTVRSTISNMPIINTFEDSVNWPGWYWDIFNTTLPMSSYLVAFVVSDFISITSNKNDHVKFKVWTREEAIDQGQYALDIGPDVLTFFEVYYDIPFPLPKQDMVALPDFDAGAMENWGLITYRETALLYDYALSSATNKQRVGVVVAHELAHQWFGDLVSPAWWSYIWLNEGFASYLENVGLDAVEPTFGMLDQSIINKNQLVFRTDSMETSHPISFDVDDPAEIWQMFDTITYDKGASIIRMMNYFLTEATFKQGLTNYLNSLSYSSATQDDLWMFLSAQAHADGTLPLTMTVTEIMNTWTLQMGYPVLTVSRSADGTQVNVTQERFLTVRTGNSNDTNDYMWWIPITYTPETNAIFTDTSTKVWMKDTEKEIVISGFVKQSSWIIFNIQEIGYYRVNYDLETWTALYDQLITSFVVINKLNRAQIIDDALNLARAGLLGYNTSLDLTLYLSDENEYVPWYGSLSNLDYIEQMFTRTAGYGSMKKYLLSLLTPKLYDMVSFTDSLADPHQLQILRTLALSWSCHMGYASCLDDSVTLYSQWMANPTNLTIVSPNLKSTVYCWGIAKGDSPEWNFAWSQYMSSNLGTEKDYLLYAMGCSEQLWILQNYLDLAFTDGSGIKKQDAYKVFNAVSGNDLGRDLAWDYLRQNWDAIAAYYGSHAQCGSFTKTATREFNTEEKLAEVEAVRAEHLADLGSSTQSIDQAIENVKNNIAWMNSYYATINQWLKDHNF